MTSMHVILERLNKACADYVDARDTGKTRISFFLLFEIILVA